MNDTEHFKQIIEYFKRNNIDYILMFSKDSLKAYKYPYDLRINYSEKSGYRVSYVLWSESSPPDIKIIYADSVEETVELIKKINNEFKSRSLNQLYVQERLLI